MSNSLTSETSLLSRSEAMLELIPIEGAAIIPFENYTY